MDQPLPSGDAQLRAHPAGSPGALVELLTASREYNPALAGRLIEIFYPELRRIAAAQMRGEQSGHSWQPTLLVNELYLELTKVQALRPADPANQQEKAAFFNLAGRIMKRLLIHHARPLYRRWLKIPVEDYIPDQDAPGAETLSELESLLERLQSINPKLRQVVEYKVFHGLAVEEIAQRLECAPITVKRYWAFAKEWLADQFSDAGRA